MRTKHGARSRDEGSRALLPTATLWGTRARMFRSVSLVTVLGLLVACEPASHFTADQGIGGEDRVVLVVLERDSEDRVQDRLVVVCSRQAPLARNETVRWRDLNGHPIIAMCATAARPAPGRIDAPGVVAWIAAFPQGSIAVPR